jgi:DNA ligase-1
MRLLETIGPSAEKDQFVLPHDIVGPDDLEVYEECCIEDGYEGVMVRTSNSPYKCGRSTEREGYLLKIKRFEDSEAVIVGWEEKTHNANEAEKDELGRTKRSSHKANQIPMGTLGALLVRDCVTDVEFKVGTGFDDSTRDFLWGIRNSLNGKIIKFKSQPTGVKDKPRFPVFLGMRSSV